MTNHILTRAKAYAALVGSVATALLGIYSTGQLGHVLTVVAAIATAVTTYAVPNASGDDLDNPGEDGAVSVATVCLAVIAAVLLLSWLGVHGHIG